MHSAGRNAPHRWPAVAAIVAVLVLAVGAGVVLGRLTAEDTAAPRVVSDAGACPSPRTGDGAMKAAVCYAMLLYRLEGRPDGTVREQLDVAAAGSAAVPRLARLVSQGAPAGGRAAAGVLTARVDRVAEQTALVFLWTAVARSATPGSPDSDAVVDVSWSTEAVDLRWAGDRWLLGEVNRSGTPPPAGTPNLAPDWVQPAYAER